MKAIRAGLVVFIVFWLASISYALDLSQYFPFYYGYGGLYKTYSLQEDRTEYEIQKISLFTLPDQQLVFKVQEAGSILFPEEPEGEFWLYQWTDQGLLTYGFFDYETNPSIVYFNPPKILLPKEINLGQTTYTDLASVSLLSTDETVTVPAGVFENCAHVGFQVIGDPCYTDIWFAKDVGIVKTQETCPDDTGISELVAARLNNKIIGYPFCEGQNISFAFSLVRTSGCSLIIDGIAVQGSTDTFWAKLDLDLSDFTFKPNWNYIGVGNAPTFELSCTALPGLSLSKEGYVWDCQSGYLRTAGIFLTAYYGDTPYYLELSFDNQNILFSIVRIWDQHYNLVWSRY